MVRARDLLDRFRPVAAPGAASGVGVPSDRLAEVTAELEPVFALLADLEDECAQIRRTAEVEAQRRRGSAAEQVAHVIASGRERAAAERAGSTAMARQQADAAAAAVTADAAEHADELVQRARQRLPALVEVVTASVLAVNEDPAQASAGPSA